MKFDLSKKLNVLIILIILITALFLRFYKLDLRLFHHDEGVNSTFLLTLIKDGTYHYNPENFHGPLLYYLTYIPVSIIGLKSSLINVENPDIADISFRIPPAFFGLLLVILFITLKSWLGRWGVITTMILTALSTSNLFYSRYNIHEIYLIFFTLLTFVSGYYFYKTRKNIYIYLAFMNLAFMFTLKETAIINMGIFFLSLMITTFFNSYLNGENSIAERWKILYKEFGKKLINPIPIVGVLFLLFTLIAIYLNPGKLAEKAENYWNYALFTKGVSVATLFLLFSFLFRILKDRTLHILTGILIFFIVISVFYSSLFTYSKGIASFFLAFENWVSAGTIESVQSKPFFYFLKILFEYESPILILGILALIFSLRKDDPIIIFTISWTVLAFIINSAIPYKTPWLVFNIILPITILAGKFIQDLINSLDSKLKVTIFSITALLIISRFAYTSINLSFVNYDNDQEEIVYVQTVRDAKKLVERTFELTKSFDGYNTKIHITPSDLWPLPWYFRDYNAILYNALSDAPIIIINSEKKKELERNLKERYSKENYPLRPGVNLTLYYQSKKGSQFNEEKIFKKIEDHKIDRRKLRPGLIGKVYHSAYFSGNLIEEKVFKVINFQFDSEEEKPYTSPFSIIWEGYLYVPQDGNYGFITESDDGSWIYINNKLVVDNGGIHGTQRVVNEINLEQGYYKIRVKYFDNYFGAIMRLKWRNMRGFEELLTDKNLFYIE